MSWFQDFIFNYKLRRAEKLVNGLCESIMTMYRYFASSHRGDLLASNFIKESIPFIAGWQASSKDVFKHKQGGIFEVKPNDSLFEIVKKMVEIEAEHLARSFPAVSINDLQNEAVRLAKEFFRDNNLPI